MDKATREGYVFILGHGTSLRKQTHGAHVCQGKPSVLGSSHRATGALAFSVLKHAIHLRAFHALCFAALSQNLS